MSKRGEFLKVYSTRDVPRSYLMECANQFEGKTDVEKETLAAQFIQRMEKEYPLRRGRKDSV